MNQIFSMVGLNSVGLALATWGVTMLIGTHHPFLPVVEVILTSTGLGLILSGTGWLTILMLVGGSRQRQETDVESAPARATTPTTSAPRCDKLAAAMEDLRLFQVYPGCRFAIKAAHCNLDTLASVIDTGSNYVVGREARNPQYFILNPTRQ